MSIKQTMWNNPLLSPFINTASYIKNVIWLRIVFKTKTLWRRVRKGSPYREIEKYKDKYKGKRCFIIATGPSLTEEDVQKLKNEYTFGMNSVCLMTEKLGWSTTFYGVQDPYVYEKLQGKILADSKPQYFVSDLLYNNYKCPSNAIPFSLNYLNHRHTYKRLFTKFSGNVAKEVFDGYTITYSLMQIAAYMGFSKIYLIGNDCNYSKDPTKQHFADFGHSDPNADFSGRRILFAYEVARDFSMGKDFEIVNCTRGGALELYRRANLDDVLAGKE